MRAARLAVAAAGLLLAAMASAQAGARLADVAIGFRGAPVADAWNPVRVTVRDVGSGHLTLVADQGSLREGEVPWTIVLPVPGGAGVRVLEADVYVPAWRSLVWSLEAGGAVVASGALPRDAADRRRLDLVVSARPGAVAERLAGRVVDLEASALPARAAAYDGVRSVWVDGSAGIPSPAALTAAAAAGAVVVFADDALLDATWSALLAWGPDWTPVAAGGWWRGEPPSGASLEGGRIDLHAWVAAFAAVGGATPPAALPAPALVLASSAYVLLVLLAWRAGGLPGLLTWLVLLGGASLLAVLAVRPPSATLFEARALQVAAGELAWRTQLHDVFTLPAAEVSLPRVARTAAAVAGSQRLGALPATTLALPRWRGATLLEPPRATEALLGWGADGNPLALGTATLTHVRIVGGGAWDAVAPGQPLGEPRDPRPLDGAAAAFEALLPVGSAWARAGSDWHVALPAGVRW